jgi:hypothetical protein
MHQNGNAIMLGFLWMPDEGHGQQTNRPNGQIDIETPPATIVVSG